MMTDYNFFSSFLGELFLTALNRLFAYCRQKSEHCATTLTV